MAVPEATFVATCRTEGCVNEGVPLEIRTLTTRPWFACGPCGIQITDITEQ